MPILWRSCCFHSCWLIIIIVSELTSQQKYHITRDLYERSSLMQPTFPQHYIIQKLPPHMNNACAVLKNNSNRCSYCAETVLTAIGKLAVNSCYRMLLMRFDSEESFIDHCVEEIYYGYIVKVVEHGKNRLLMKRDFLNFLDDARLQE